MDPLEASRLVTDEYSAKILVATFKKAKSAIDLSREYGIPIAACYRRIHALERAGLIRCTERALTQKGKRISLYMSQLKNAYIFFENGRLRVRFQLATGITRDFGGDWKAVDVVEPILPTPTLEPLLHNPQAGPRTPRPASFIVTTGSGSVRWTSGPSSNPLTKASHGPCVRRGTFGFTIETVDNFLLYDPPKSAISPWIGSA